VFVNLQAAFLSPPVAMSAFYLKGVAPKHVTLSQIFAGMMPYILIVIRCMIIVYFYPGMTRWLSNYLYGGGWDWTDNGLSASRVVLLARLFHRKPAICLLPT